MPKKKGEKDAFDYINPVTKKYVKPFTDWCFQSRYHTALTVTAIILIIIFASFVKQVMIISLLILLGGISRIYQRYFTAQVGIEFIMLVTVVSAFVYGSFVGAFVGFAAFMVSVYFSGRVSHKLFLSFILVTIVGLTAPLLKGLGIATAGIILTFFYDLILIPLHIAWFQTKLHRLFLFTLTHFFWNVWVFTTIAQGFLNLFT
ncbi:hypothetical protein GOV08_00240 [Candidatus Woesearchaeota archaeon]|nr:hypothetical protein [Candidatus Woesearchaeota archaeon]